MTTPIDSMIDASVWCATCGTKGMFNCDCHVQCSCGWIASKGKPCRNPETTRCSTKLKYRPKPELRKGERVVLNREVNWIPCDALRSEEGYFGTVAATPRKGSELVSIRWDGRTSCDRIHMNYLDKA